MIKVTTYVGAYIPLQACQISQTNHSGHGQAPGHCTDLPRLPTEHSYLVIPIQYKSTVRVHLQLCSQTSLYQESQK